MNFHVLSFSNPRNGVDITATPENQPSETPATPTQQYMNIYIYTSNFKASREMVVNLNLPEFQIMKKHILGCTEFTIHRAEQCVK